MKSALIPADMGDKKTARTCVGPNSCRGECSTSSRRATSLLGGAEDVAIAHAVDKGDYDVRVHVFESGRGRTFKVWLGRKGYEAREVL